MRLWLPAFFAITAITPLAALGAEQETKTRKKNPASSLLPDGSQLHGVVIPRHNEQRQLVNSLMAEVVTLINDEVIKGERVIVDFYDGMGKPNARIQLREAIFNQARDMLHASEQVTINSETYQARGTGLHYAMRQGRGLLTGPVTTTILNPPETSMKPKTPSKPRTLLKPNPSSVFGAAGIALAMNTVTNAEMNNPPVHGGYLVQASTAQAPVKINTVTEGPVSKARSESEAALKKIIQNTSTTTAEVKEFVETIPLDYEQLTNSKRTAPPSKPLEIEPSPQHTLVNCESGMYFDSDKGILVYLKNVKVTDPQYVLTGADVLQIHMAKKPEIPEENKRSTEIDKPQESTTNRPAIKNGPVPAIGGNFDEVEKIVATGAVRILQKSVEKGKKPVEASGALFTYHPETGDILLSGGYPWVKQGDFFARAKEPNLTLRMKKNGDFVTEGNWEMGGRLNQKKAGPNSTN